MTTAVLRIQGQRWPRCRDRAIGSRRSRQSSGPFPRKAWASLSPIVRDRVIRGAWAKLIASPWRRFRHAREDGLLSLFIGAAIVAGARFASFW